MSHIRIKNEYLRTPEFIKFIKSAKGSVLLFVLASVIRESHESKNYTNGSNYIYNEHFLKGELVGRYRQEDMAKYLNTHQSRISRYIKELEKDGLIKTIKRYIKKGKILYYQVGVWEGKLGTDSYKETLWFDEIFTAYSNVAKQKRGEKRAAELPSLKDMVHLLNKDHEDYERTKDEWMRG